MSLCHSVPLSYKKKKKGEKFTRNSGDMQEQSPSNDKINFLKKEKEIFNLL